MRYQGPFYLTPLPKATTNDDIWYKRMKLGVNSIDNMMKSLMLIHLSKRVVKKLTNHSARKTLVKKLRANNVERASIMSVTGHRNEQSLNDYDEGNEVEQRHISNMISNNSKAGQFRTNGNLIFATTNANTMLQLSTVGFIIIKQFVKINPVRTTNFTTVMSCST